MTSSLTHPDRRTNASPPPAESGRWAVATLALCMLLSSLGTSIANVGLPTIAQAFGASFQQAQWIVLAYLLAITALIVAAGRLGDLVGRRQLLLSGISLFTAASILCGMAPTLFGLVAARVAQGAGAAIMMAITMAAVSEAAPRERTGGAMGLLGTMSAVGTALGPSLGGWLIAWWGWPGLFLINAPLGVLALVLAKRYLPLDQRPRGMVRQGFDPAGAVLLVAVLVAYSLAMTMGRGSFGALNAALLAVAILGMGLFTLVEKRAPAPLIPLEMLHRAGLLAGFGMNSLVMTVVMATLVVGPFYLTQALQLSAAQVGLVMSCGPVITALTGIPAGRLADSWGASRTRIAGLGLMLLGCTALVALPSGFGIPGYVIPLGLVTAGYALFQTANNATVMADVSSADRGVVSGLLNLSRNLGLITGASLMGAVYALGSAAGNVLPAAPAAAAAGMRITFGVAAGLVMVALAIAVFTSGKDADRPM
ncbi:MAG: MFS transporter [Acidobacteria bacterium]|nr:MFS transporter [Acidobacteriota bacterium]